MRGITYLWLNGKVVEWMKRGGGSHALRHVKNDDPPPPPEHGFKDETCHRYMYFLTW